MTTMVEIAEEKRIKIAEACGWTPTATGWWTRAITGMPSKDFPAFTDPPDYLNDLNAMHEAESILTLDQSTSYVNKLWPQGYSVFHAVHATAEHRAEAFGLILGLWKEGE